jgi:hypothetical protein
MLRMVPVGARRGFTAISATPYYLFMYKWAVNCPPLFPIPYPLSPIPYPLSPIPYSLTTILHHTAAFSQQPFANQQRQEQ